MIRELPVGRAACSVPADVTTLSSPGRMIDGLLHGSRQVTLNIITLPTCRLCTPGRRDMASGTGASPDPLRTDLLDYRTPDPASSGLLHLARHHCR